MIDLDVAGLLITNIGLACTGGSWYRFPQSKTEFS